MSEQNSVSVTKNGLAIFGLVCGIVAAFCSILLTLGTFIVWFGWPASAIIVAIVSFLAIITSAIALGQIKKSEQGGKRAAIWGIVLGAIAILLVLFYIFVLGPAIQSVFNDIQNTLIQ